MSISHPTLLTLTPGGGILSSPANETPAGLETTTMTTRKTSSAALLRALKAQSTPETAFDPHALISARILRRVRDGADVADALDDVCGAGTFQKLASDLYDRLRERS
jgi:hypothetical protein